MSELPDKILDRVLYNKDIAQTFTITSDSTSTTAMNWLTVNSSHGTFSGHFEGYATDLLEMISDAASSTFNIEYKLGDDTTITMSNVTIQPNDISNGEGDYMIFPIKGQGITVKPPEVIETLDDQLKEVPE